MTSKTAGLSASWSDVWLLDGVRTPFADYNGALAQVSPTDLGIKVAREAFARSGVSPQDVGAVITGSTAQASFDTYCLPRHIGLYSGVPIEVPAHMVQRVCGTGIEVLMQAADVVTHKAIGLTLCVGAESMSRNPIASYTMRGFRMGSVDFKDFLWEALRDPAADVTMGDTAENLARTYQITRPEVDAYAARSFERALAAQKSGFLAGEIAPVKSETFEREGFQPRKLKLNGVDELGADTHGRSSPPPITRRGGQRSRASSPVQPSACDRTSWASVRCPPSRPCSSARGSSFRTSIASRSTKPSARRSWRARANSASTKPSSTSTAAPSPSVIRWAQPACGSPSRSRASSGARKCATASPRPASAAGRASPC